MTLYSVVPYDVILLWAKAYKAFVLMALPFYAWCLCNILLSLFFNKFREIVGVQAV